MCGIHHDRIDPGLNQTFATLCRVASCADCSRHAKASFNILTGLREFSLLLNVLNRHEPLQVERIIHQQYLLNAMLVK